MHYRVARTVEIDFQGLNLNCGRYCIEALMRWKHFSKYGVIPGRIIRTSHPPKAQQHIDKRFEIAFDPDDYLLEYQLEKIAKPQDPVAWAMALLKHGPIIVCGHIGGVRIIPNENASHFVVVIGVKDNEIEYLDSLRLDHARGRGPSCMNFDAFNQTISPSQIYVAKP